MQLISFPKINANISDSLLVMQHYLPLMTISQLLKNPQPKFFNSFFIMKEEDFLRNSIILNIKREIATKFCTKSIIYDLLGIKTTTSNSILIDNLD